MFYRSDDPTNSVIYLPFNTLYSHNVLDVSDRTQVIMYQQLSTVQVLDTLISSYQQRWLEWWTHDTVSYHSQVLVWLKTTNHLWDASGKHQNSISSLDTFTLV